jgi:hypothetical protein
MRDAKDCDGYGVKLECFGEEKSLQVSAEDAFAGRTEYLFHFLHEGNVCASWGQYFLWDLISERIPENGKNLILQ